MIPSRLKLHATFGTVAGFAEKFLNEQAIKPKTEYWIRKTSKQAGDYICHLQPVRSSDAVALDRALGVFFNRMFETGRGKHILTFWDFFLAILSDTGIMDERMTRLIGTAMKAREAIIDQYRYYPACTVAGARIADRWGEMWTQ